MSFRQYLFQPYNAVGAKVHVRSLFIFKHSVILKDYRDTKCHFLTSLMKLNQQNTHPVTKKIITSNEYKISRSRDKNQFKLHAKHMICKIAIGEYISLYISYVY